MPYKDIVSIRKFACHRFITRYVCGNPKTKDGKLTVRKINWLSGHGLFANRLAGTVRSLVPARPTDVDNPSEKTHGDKSAQWARGLNPAFCGRG